MSVYYTNDAAFELPDTECTDVTLTHLETRTESGESLTLLVERNPYPEGFTLRQVVDNHVGEAMKHLRRYSVLFQQEREIAGLPAIEVGVRWRNDDGDVYTRHAHIEVSGTWLMIAGEAMLPERAACDALMEEVLSTFRLRE